MQGRWALVGVRPPVGLVVAGLPPALPAAPASPLRAAAIAREYVRAQLAIPPHKPPRRRRWRPQGKSVCANAWLDAPSGLRRRRARPFSFLSAEVRPPAPPPAGPPAQSPPRASNQVRPRTTAATQISPRAGTEAHRSVGWERCRS